MTRKYLVTFFVICLMAFSQISFAANNENQGISVTGTATTTVEPDMATMSLQISARGATSAEATQKLAVKLQEVKRNLLVFAITEKDVKTTGYSVEPFYVREDNKSKQRGMIAKSNISITVNEISKTGEIIDRCTNIEAVSFERVNFALKNRNLIERGLLDDAVANAKEKAAIVARAGGRQLGHLLSANIGAVGGARMNSYAADEFMATKAMANDSAYVPTTVFAGTIDVSVSVYTLFSLY